MKGLSSGRGEELSSGRIVGLSSGQEVWLSGCRDVGMSSGQEVWLSGCRDVGMSSGLGRRVVLWLGVGSIMKFVFADL
jgi:hypothetical protein